MRPRYTATLYAAVISLLGSGSAFGDFIINLQASVTQDASGLYAYSYTLENLSTNGESALAFRIDVAPEADLISIIGPAVWSITYTSGDTLVVWESDDEPFDLTPGNSATFSFTSILGPDTRDYAVLGFDGSSFLSNRGQTISPGVSAVPEPSTLTLVGTGALGLIGFSWQRRMVKRGLISNRTT